MDRELWQRAESLFHAALERPPESRHAFLVEACGGDDALRRQVEALVAKADDTTSCLEKPALVVLEAPERARASLVGRQVGAYRVISLLGAGGMGEVYRARDDRLGRDVALKTLPPAFAGDPGRLARFRGEARALASLNHPNIAAIYGLEESAEAVWLVLELIEGESPRGPMAIAAALDLGRQIAGALEAAHERGLVHRDLKPANIKVTAQGIVKVLDFGLAKAIRETEPEPDVSGPTEPARTETRGVLGTPGYMSPEQARGGTVDERTDIWAFGCLLYELLAGKRAFKGDTVVETLAAVLEREPEWQALATGTPPLVRDLLRRCLRKDARQRLANMAEARSILERAWRRQSRWRFFVHGVRRPRFVVPALAALGLVCLLAVRAHERGARVRWVREQATPEISRLMEAGEYQASFRLLRRAEAIVPDDPALQRIHESNGIETSFRSNPPGAEVFATGYAPDDDEWLRLGTTPFTTRELWLGFYRFRTVKPGLVTVTAAREVRGGWTLSFDLDEEGALPAGMLRVSGGTVVAPGLDPVELRAFLIDRDEVTNRQFKLFVDRGGYRSREYWTEDFVQDGRRLSWDEAMRAFRDASGQPGPSTWRLGSFPQGRGEYPVNGVSWFEAAAYAAFAGKQLPTIYHWQRAASPGWFFDVTTVSNLGGAGPAPVGAFKGLGAYGTLDMAGNVKEWCWNESAGRRYLRGGAWNEPSHMFAVLDARVPWDRSEQNGIRCVRYDARQEASLATPVTRPVRDRGKQTPVSDDVFGLYRSLYSYDPAELDSRVEGVDETPYWRRERVAFASPEGNERVSAYLYVPRNARPPYQAVIYAHPGMSLRLPSPQPGEQLLFDFVVKSGRAFLLPVLKGQYQRRYAGPPTGPNAARDRLIVESKEFRRSIDYLESRKDVDRERLGVLGISRGGGLLPVLAVGERRLKAAVLLSVGLFDAPGLPEADPLNFLPRFTVPTLMMCGRSDFVLPPETSQLPMFRLLGAPEKEKQVRYWEGGHMPPNLQVPIREALAWFDRYLGPVRR